MNIRLEQPQDWREVENLTREAFWNVYRPGCQEHFVLNQFRDNPAFIPELDLVMEEDGRIIGHVMFSKAEITLADGTLFPSWTFGPISVDPDYKRKGYGLKLLRSRYSLRILPLSSRGFPAIRIHFLQESAVSKTDTRESSSMDSRPELSGNSSGAASAPCRQAVKSASSCA